LHLPGAELPLCLADDVDQIRSLVDERQAVTKRTHGQSRPFDDSLEGGAMATRKKSTRNGSGSGRSKNFTRRAVLAGLGAGLVVPSLKADASATATPMVFKSGTACPPTPVSVSLAEYPKFKISFNYDSEHNTLTISIS
jgi:hypothetical protein